MREMGIGMMNSAVMVTVSYARSQERENGPRRRQLTTPQVTVPRNGWSLRDDVTSFLVVVKLLAVTLPALTGRMQAWRVRTILLPECITENLPPSTPVCSKHFSLQRLQSLLLRVGASGLA